MPRYIRTDHLCEMIEEDRSTAIERILARCAELDETPEEYGFEFVVDDDNVGREGLREIYYAYKYDRGDLRADESVYILGPDDGAEEAAEIVRYVGVIYADGDRIAHSDEDSDRYFDTVRECVAWLNKRLGAELIKKGN